MRIFGGTFSVQQEKALVDSPLSITWSQRGPMGSGSLVCLPSLRLDSLLPSHSPDSSGRWGLLEATVSSSTVSS